MIGDKHRKKKVYATNPEHEKTFKTFEKIIFALAKGYVGIEKHQEFISKWATRMKSKTIDMNSPTKSTFFNIISFVGYDFFQGS